MSIKNTSPEGFEPSTTGSEAPHSIQAKLRAHYGKYIFILHLYCITVNGI